MTLLSSKNRTQHQVSTSHQLHRPTHSIHQKRFQTWMVPFFSRHFSFIRTRQNSTYYSLQKTTHTDHDYIGTATTTYLLCKVCLILTHRTRTVCANPQLLHKEEDLQSGDLLRCKYSTQALNRLMTKCNHNTAIYRPKTVPWTIIPAPITPSTISTSTL